MRTTYAFSGAMMFALWAALLIGPASAGTLLPVFEAPLTCNNASGPALASPCAPVGHQTSQIESGLGDCARRSTVLTACYDLTPTLIGLRNLQ
jgi:hypothetical protein